MELVLSEVGADPEESVTGKDTLTPEFNTAPFTIARTGKHPRCPSTDGQIRKL